MKIALYHTLSDYTNLAVKDRLTYTINLLARFEIDDGKKEKPEAALRMLVRRAEGGRLLDAIAMGNRMKTLNLRLQQPGKDHS